jgi:soluble lytic murein transglycosylase-like protein
MITYEQPMPAYWSVETPLSEEYEYEAPLILDQYAPSTDVVQQRMLLILFSVLAIAGLAAVFVVPKLGVGQGAAAQSAAAAPASSSATSEDSTNQEVVMAAVAGAISPVFSGEIQHWAPQIVKWAADHSLDPDMVATIMQIESCGDPQAHSHAGAQGLFQVMPFHFVAGEDMLDPDTNARRGMAYFAERLVQTAGDVGKAFAGYNGGHVAAGGNWNTWANETQRYYTWSTGIYQDAKAGLTESPTLKEWFAAGGASLCQQAANQLGLQ